MANEDCEAIERHIKDLLSLPYKNSPNVSEFVGNKLPEANAHLEGKHILQHTGNYPAFSSALSPQKGPRSNVFVNRSPMSCQEERRGINNHMGDSSDHGIYHNACNTYSPKKQSQNFSNSSHMYHQMHDIRFLSIQKNSEQTNGSMQGFAASSGSRTSINSHVPLEAIPDQIPVTCEKLCGEKTSKSFIQASPQRAVKKSEYSKDARNRKKKKKDKKKRTKYSPERHVSNESVSNAMRILSNTSLTNIPFPQEKQTFLEWKGDSTDDTTPPKGSDIIRYLNKTPFSRDKESVVVRREGQLWFCCYLCDYSCSDISVISKHIAMPNHKAQLKAKEMRHLLFHIPKPLPKQGESITNCIVHVADRYGLSDDDLNLRKAVVDHIKEKIESHIPDCHLEPIGSSITGFGLKKSHVDIVLKVPKEKNAADMLFTTFELLKEDECFTDVHNEFRKKIPQIEFVDVESGLTCNICIDNGTVSEFTKLLCEYSKLDPRARVLGTAFRYWAKICEVDQQDQGTLPPFCYVLMTIYFLQQQQPPVLPVIQKDSNIVWCSKNTDSIGELWLKLIRYYSIEYQGGEDVVCIRTSEKISCEDKNWGTKILAIEDPIVQRNLAHVIPNRQVYQYIHDCLIQTYSYFGHPQFYSGPAKLICVHKSDKPVSNMAGSKSGNMAFHSTDVEKKLVSSEDMVLSDDILNITDLVEDQDPELPYDDVISIVNNLTIDEILSEEEMEKDSSAGIADWGKNTFENSRAHDASPSLFANFPSLTIIAPEQVPVFSEVHHDNMEQKNVCQNSFLEHFITDDSEETYSWNLDKENMDEIHYEFSLDHFRGDKCVPLVCSLCQKQGHQKKNCPDENLPAIVPLSQLTSEYIAVLDSVCHQIVRENQPSSMELKMRDEDLEELEDYVRQIFPDAKLQMFGSFCNGFGFNRSDMDICLTFKENTTGKDLDCAALIEELAQKLCENPKLSNVVAITSAKVPIVKFVFRESGLEGDISLYNTLAQHNTKMLDMYSKIDERVRVLGYTLKYFAKILNIGDASRGSLSSYAYILMVLFFLQQRDPPVIPVLQELHNGKQPILMVDEWNAWFYNNLENLPNVWEDYGKNEESVGELWLGLLRFYTEEFDNNEHVVCIRQKKYLTRFRKLWNSKSIAIEDPFDLSHNLGSGLSRRMNNYIMKAFIRGRNHFGTSVGKIPSGVSPKDFLFDRRVLCDGQEPPNDRGCRYCGKIGHVIKDCPKKTQKKQEHRRRSSVPKNQSTNKSMDDQVPGHRPGFHENRGYQRKEYEKRSHHRNRSPKNNSIQQNIAKINFERSIDIQPAKINHLLSLQRFPGPGLVTNSFNPPPFVSKIPPSFVHRPATSTPFPIMNSAVITSLSPHKNSLTQHCAMYPLQHQNCPTNTNNAQGENSHCLTTQQKNVFGSNEYSLPFGGAHSNNGQAMHNPTGKQQQFRGHSREDIYASHNHSGRW